MVLGFDAGCATCSDVAKRIEERLGDKIEVRSLHHPQVKHWRERALGADATWAPTLFEVGGVREVRAWTGPRMAVRLARTLGPVSTWRVMRSLGEVGTPKTADLGPPLAGMDTAGISRGRFLKGMGGAALAFGLLSGVASPARAAQSGVNEEALVQAFSMIEEIPDPVAARGNRAAERWLRDRMQAGPPPGTVQPLGVLGCARSIIVAILSNAIPVLKIRKAIRVFGGARNLARFIVRTYRRFRRLGNGPRRAIRKTARAVARRVFKLSGEDVLSAFLSLFSLSRVRRECF